MTPFSRRTFLAAGAGGLLAVACAKASKAGGAGTTAPASGGSNTDTVLVPFFKDGIQMAGTGQRLPFGLGNSDGVLATGGPAELTFQIVDAKHAVVAETTVPRHAQGLPRPYWPLQIALPEPGIYTAYARFGETVASSAFSLADTAAVTPPRPGQPMVAVETPTVADGRGVTPICTRDPICALHQVTLSEALRSARPVALLIGTPAYCQTAVCGPVLDVLLAQRAAYPAVAMVHAEVYQDPEKALSSGSTTPDGADLGLTTEAVDAYRLSFEPALFIAGADGVISSCLYNIWDADELDAALAKVS